ncbi:ComF family protein [Flagellimonas allohymeniacidonis]|uniref:ComF family protein n=2 Tax=Flagellimonas allohymeniacidonis TaxID=2517819 RepID=A0A4Q8QG78_9FLAO|nr:ComF family protein [Allomuricauda hymeniacidonis]
MVCFGCNVRLSRGENLLCTVCRHDMPLTEYNFIDENAVDRIFYGRIPMKKGASFVFFSKNGIVKNLLHQLKYKNQEEVGRFFGDWYGSLLKRDKGLQDVDVVVPVPLHPRKEKKRGYNQVRLFAKRLAHHLKVDLNTDLLVKVRNTKTQTKKDRQLRWLGTKEAFKANTTASVPYKHILLVDDVITTGATLEACANELLQLGDVTISVASIAVVPKG